MSEETIAQDQPPAQRKARRVLVTWGSKRGGTAGIARILGAELQRQGLDVTLLASKNVRSAAGFDAVVVGGALYANRWHPDARQFVNRHERELRRVPVWFFSSGPLDDSAEREAIAPTRPVRVLMDRVGATEHVTFGGRLAPDARGFPASAMAKEHAGDFRRPERIEAWASEIARALPTARPGVAITPSGRSPLRVVLHALVGWAACAAAMGGLLAIAALGTALVAHAIAAPMIFGVVAWHYFREDGARDPTPTAFTFVAIVALLDLMIVAGLVQHSLVMFASIVGSWLPFLLIFLTTWIVGELMSTMPWPKPSAKPRVSSAAGALQNREQ
jgi:menaquinone-dependent protoporphyrinogen oxidase